MSGEDRSAEFMALMEGSDVQLTRLGLGADAVLESALFEDAWTMQNGITDRLVPASKLRVVVGMDPLGNEIPKLRVGSGFGSEEYLFTSTAFAQLCEKSGMGVTSYMKKCLAVGLHTLVPTNMNLWLRLQEDKPMFVRTYEGSVIAVLSDRYGVFDHGDALDCLFDALDSTGAREQYVIEAHAMTVDTLNVRLVDKEQILLTDGSHGRDTSTAGLIFRNGQTGRSTASVEFLVYTFACTNGLIVSTDRGSVFKKKHMGVDKGVFRDNLANALEQFPAYVEAARNSIEAARNVRVNAQMQATLAPMLKRDLALSDENVVQLFELMDERWDDNVWGAAGALTELAQRFTAERQYQMEKYAGQLMEKLAA